MSSSEADYIQIEDEQTRVFVLNAVAMRKHNRELATTRYYGLEATPQPMRPLLYKSGAPEPYLYEPSAPPLSKGDQNDNPIGTGPDRWGYYSLVIPDYHAVGDLFQARDGSVYCKVEAPTREGSFEGKWVKVM